MNQPFRKSIASSSELATRIKLIREEVYGDSDIGPGFLAAELDVPVQTWINYEKGVTMPATVMLFFIEKTGANSGWLLTGQGERFLGDRRGAGGQQG